MDGKRFAFNREVYFKNQSEIMASGCPHPTLSKSPTSPFFDFPPFDELFETMGDVNTKLKVHATDRTRAYMQSHGSFVSKQHLNDIVTIAEPSDGLHPHRVKLTKDESIGRIIWMSWEGSKSFFGFRRKLGNNLFYKYCTCCRPDVVVFLFLHVVLGFLLTSGGILGVSKCPAEMTICIYITIDGVFCVFIFPIIISGWTHHIGGCVNESVKVGNGICWGFALLLRLASVCVGTVLLFFHEDQIYNETENVVEVCELAIPFAMSAIGVSWGFIVILILIPFIVYFLLYLTGHRYQSVS